MFFYLKRISIDWGLFIGDRLEPILRRESISLLTRSVEDGLYFARRWMILPRGFVGSSMKIMFCDFISVGLKPERRREDSGE